VRELLEHGTGPIILTRADDEQARSVLAAHPEALRNGPTIVWRQPVTRRHERVLVCAAGTADASVADECIATLEGYGFDPDRLIDVGVAGLHRLLAHVDLVADADAIVVVAGMEGALASVIGGIASGPVVAVPTSTGYGSALDGVTALLAMLSSCASGITVVGIDNGFGAACAVARIFQTRTTP
jgi:NCAIR mutase (PurE)-related protein